MFVVFFSLAAQAADTAAPDAGSILQQIQPAAPLSPAPAGTGLTIERESTLGLPPGIPFEVKAIRISGNTLFDTPTLHALIADAEGKSLTLAQLGELAARLTAYYRDHGYQLARAIIPAQTIRDGMVLIEILEARYGKISLDNHSRIDDPLLLDTLSSLQSSQIITQADLDRALLLLSDVPGATFSATLKPGEAAGTSDLLVEALPGPAISGNMALDNYGNRYTGRARIGGTVSFINPLGRGDALNISGLSSGSGVNYGRIAYEFLLNGQGTRMGGSYSALHYILGEPLASINAHGTAQVESLWAKHPFVRSQNVNLHGHIQYDRVQLRDRIDVTASRTDRHLESWTAGLAGDMRGMLLPGAVSTWDVDWTSGRVGFDDTVAQLLDAATAGTQGGFSKWNANFTHLQRLGQENSLYLALSGQWANTNLDSSKKMTAGGAYTVRAYDMGVASGDTGYLGTIEFRRHLGFAWHGQWQAVAFADSAHLIINKAAWTAGTNSITLNGVGAGLDWAGTDQWNVKAYVAVPVGSIPVSVTDTSPVRAWVEIGRRF